MTSIATSAQVESFVRDVRAQLDDLPAEVADDLVEGLAADLVAQEAEGGAVPGDAAVYAAELRAGAGLPPAPSRRPGSALKGWERLWREDLEPEWRRLRSSRAGGWTSDRARELKPALWLLPAWLVYQLAYLGGAWPDVVPQTWHGWVFLAALTVVSLECGRRFRSYAPRQRRIAYAVVSVGSLLCLIAVLGFAPGPTTGGWDGSVQREGLWLDDEPVANLFPYDAQGRPLEGVQLYTDSGLPLHLSGTAMSAMDRYDPTTGGWLSRVGVPVAGSDGLPLRHVFPYRVGWAELPNEAPTRGVFVAPRPAVMPAAVPSGAPLPTEPPPVPEGALPTPTPSPLLSSSVPSPTPTSPASPSTSASATPGR